MQYCGEVQQVVVLQQHYQFHTAEELVQARLTNAGTILLTYRPHNPTFVSLWEASLVPFLTSMLA